MLRIGWFLVLFAIKGAFAQIDCVPDAVDDISLSLDYTLSWAESTNCENIDYIIYVHGEFGLDHIYQVNSSRLDVSFLPHCEQYHFIVVAHSASANTVSVQNAIDALIPAPPDADLTIEYFNVSHSSDGLLLEWSVDEKYEHCAHYYRVVISFISVRDEYVEDNSLLIKEFVPCMNHYFTVRAIYNLAIEGPMAEAFFVTPEAPTPLPTLQSVALGETYVNVSWILAAYFVNPCPITSMVVDGLPYYGSEHLISDGLGRPHPTITLSPLRSDTMYYFRIYVVNSAGRSEPYRIAIQTLPPGGED